MSRNNAKQKFEHAVLELLQDKPFEVITTKEIVDKSCLTRQSFYNHYFDKFDLVNQIFATDANSSMLLFSDKTVSWDTVILRSLKTMKEKQYFYANVLRYQGQNSLTNFFAEYIIKVHSDLIGSNMLQSTSKENVNGLIRFHAYGTAYMTTDWAVSGMKNQPEELANLIFVCMPDLMKNSYKQIQPH